MKKKNRKGKREFLFDDLVVLPTNEINSSRTQIKQTLSKEGGAAGLEPLVKELVKLGFKKDITSSAFPLISAS